MSNQVGSGDVAPHTPRRIDTVTLPAIESCRQNHFFGNDFIFQDPLIVIDVIDEFIQAADALDESTLNPTPLLCAGNSGDQIERKNLLRTGGIAVDVERN